MDMIEGAILLCALACAALLLAEWRGSRLGVWLTKPAAAACFVFVGLQSGGFSSSYGTWIVIGLVLSALGDVLLIPEGKALLFLSGMLSFLCAHVAYCVAFVDVGLDPTGLAVFAVVVVPLAAIVVRWLRPHLKGVFRSVTPIYILVISLMVLLSGSASASTGNPMHAAGAMLFALSDVSVARDRFIARGFVNAAWGLPLYFTAQILLALSISGVSPSVL